jgi:outer membrane lipoprotein SlyB
MKMTILISVCLFLTTLVAGPVLAQDPIVFPAKGQSQDQMEKDKFSCYQWAKQETGFDPMKVPTATSPPPQQQARRGGAVRGAAGGAVIGGIAGGSKGARRGAAAGGVIGGARTQSQRRQDEQARKQWEQEQAAQYAQSRNTYNRAYSACMEGRGYTVK